MFLFKGTNESISLPQKSDWPSVSPRPDPWVTEVRVSYLPESRFHYSQLAVGSTPGLRVSSPHSSAQATFPPSPRRFPKAHFSTNQLFFLPLKMDPKAHFSPLCHDITEGKRRGKTPNSDFITNPLLTPGSWCQQQESSQRNPSHCVPPL